MRRRIALYVHPAHGFGPRYLLFRIVEAWRARDIETIVLDDPGKVVGADIGFLHVDLTEVPTPYRALNEQYPVVVNGHRTSIAKRVVSVNLVDRASGYAGPVIVKSNENVAGLQDDKARGNSPVWRPEVRRRLNNWLPRALTGGVFATYYRVYPSLAEVPRVVWSMDRLVVEKFLPERRGDAYCVRYLKRLGGGYDNTCLQSDNWEVKAARQVKEENSDPDAVLMTQFDTWRRKFRVDYAKFDYVLRDGAPVLFDVNPTIGPYTNKAAEARVVAQLERGIDQFFERPRSATSDRSV